MNIKKLIFESINEYFDSPEMKQGDIDLNIKDIVKNTDRIKKIYNKPKYDSPEKLDYIQLLNKICVKACPQLSNYKFSANYMKPYKETHLQYLYSKILDNVVIYSKIDIRYYYGETNLHKKADFKIISNYDITTKHVDFEDETGISNVPDMIRRAEEDDIMTKALSTIKTGNSVDEMVRILKTDIQPAITKFDKTLQGKYNVDMF